MRHLPLTLLLLCLFLGPPTTRAEEAAEAKPAAERSFTGPLVMVVMDPLAEPLSCPCVEGYAQRKYDKLAAFLTQQLGREVKVYFGESLKAGLEKAKAKSADIVIGKDSVVRAHAKRQEMKVEPLAALTGKDGVTTQTGLIVVRSADSAKELKDLEGYRILYGPDDCDEKFAAPRALLKAAGIKVVAADEAEITVACSDGACKIIEWGDSERAAAVISSYAAPLLEGCGTIKKGDLRVVAETKPVPFIRAFANTRLAAEEREAIRSALLGVIEDPELTIALETLTGFEPIEEPDSKKTGETPSRPVTTGKSPPGDASASAAGWTGWRGPNRDARCRALPTRLPEPLEVVWTIPLAHAGLGGIAATPDRVIIGDRDLENQADEFRCYDAANGDLVWIVTYPAPGKLDYDNTPRATPLIDDDRVYLFGAFGDLTCVDLESGAEWWRMNLREKFGVDEQLVWGTCSSPLLVGGKLIVNPGAPHASLVALDPLSGAVLWQSPGEAAGYGSLIVATLGGRTQIVGYDRSSLGGWDPATGERLWKLLPKRAGDFNVPTPVVVGDKLLVTTEGNGTRLYAFDNSGKIIDTPVAMNSDLASDMGTPVIAGNSLYCVAGSLFCLDLSAGLATRWIEEDPAIGEYAPLIVSDDRLLVVGRGSEVILLDTTSDQMAVVSRQFIVADPQTRQADVYAHPAVVGSRLFVRGENFLACVELEAVSDREQVVDR